MQSYCIWAVRECCPSSGHWLMALSVITLLSTSSSVAPLLALRLYERAKHASPSRAPMMPRATSAMMSPAHQGNPALDDCCCKAPAPHYSSVSPGTRRMALQAFKHCTRAQWESWGLSGCSIAAGRAMASTPGNTNLRCRTASERLSRAGHVVEAAL